MARRRPRTKKTDAAKPPAKSPPKKKRLSHKRCQKCGGRALDGEGYEYQMPMAGGQLTIWTCKACYEDLIRREIRSTYRTERRGS